MRKTNLIVKIIGLLIIFSGVFYFFRTSDYYNLKILSSELSGIPWLYSSIGIIFSIIAAFAMQKNLDRWNNLNAAVKAEVGAVEELWLWSVHFPEEIKIKINKAIQTYLENIIKKGWMKSELGEKSKSVEQSLILFHDVLYDIAKNYPRLLPTSFYIFSEILKHRAARLHFASHKMPTVLRGMIFFAMMLMILLSFLIAVKNFWLDYIFTASIATLVFIVFIVLDDLDNPLLPGGWHLTTKDYEELLNRIKSNNQFN